MKNNKFKKLTAVILAASIMSIAAGCEQELQTICSDASELAETCQSEIEAETEITPETIDLSETEGTVSITKAGSYIVKGSTENGMIIVEATKEDEIDITLDNISITNPTSAAIYVKKAKKVNLTLKGKNRLITPGVFEQIDDNKVNAVIYSKSDLSIGGDGAVIITADQGKGVICKDSLYITGGTYVITTAEDAINGKDFVNISGGEITIDSKDDGIHADGKLQIDGGTMTFDALEGLEGTYVVINDGNITINSSDDGINASLKDESYEKPVVEINGGNIKITMADGDTDGIDSNGDIIINGGYIDITGRSTCDYDGTATFNGGTLILNGEEATEIPNQFMGPPPVDENGNPLPPPDIPLDENGNPIYPEGFPLDENGNPLPPPPMEYDENGNPIMPPPPPWAQSGNSQPTEQSEPEETTAETETEAPVEETTVAETEAVSVESEETISTAD